MTVPFRRVYAFFGIHDLFLVLLSLYVSRVFRRVI